MRSDFSLKGQCPEVYIRSQQLCLCVFFSFILDVKFVGSTSRGHTGFLTHLFPSAVVAVSCCLHIKNRSDLYPVPFFFLLFKAKKRISVVTSQPKIRYRKITIK